MSIQNKEINILLDKHKLKLIYKINEALHDLAINSQAILLDRNVIQDRDYFHSLNKLKAVLDRIYGSSWLDNWIKSEGA